MDEVSAGHYNVPRLADIGLRYRTAHVTLPMISSDFARHSARTSAGTRRMTSMIPRGMRIKSSRYPRTGMKSGIKPIGERAYLTTMRARNFSTRGRAGGGRRGCPF